MGHLINPISTRIGKFSYWEDFWFVEHIYYPEYLHSLLKIKLYLIYFFETALFEDNKFLYSHFDFLCQYRFLIIRVYLYFVGFFRHLSEFFLELNEEFVFSAISKKSIERKRVSFELVSSIFIFFKLISGYYLDLPNDKKELNILLTSFLSLDYYLLKKILFSKLFLNIREGQKFEFLFFFSVLSFLIKELKSENVYLNSILEHLFISVISFIFLRPFFYLLKHNILVIINYLFLFFECSLSIHFYFLSNDGLTSKFISRFIAVRFTYNRFLTEVIDPVKFDLMSTMNSLTCNFGWKPSRVKVNNAKLFYKGLFKRLFLVFGSIYWKFLFKYFSKNFSWITLDLFFFFSLIWVKNLGLKKFINFTKAYAKNKAAFCLFFNSNLVFLKSVFLLVVPFEVENVYLKKLINIDFFFNKIFLDFESLYLVLADKFEYGFYDKAVYVCFFFLRNRISHNYNFLFFNLHDNFLKNYQFKSKQPKNKILGFKIHISGRLSRKDRASNIWYTIGSVPANKFSANIDYAFYTVPLINSVLRVKVWINRGIGNISWYIKIS